MQGTSQPLCGFDFFLYLVFRCSVQEENMVPYKKIMDLFLDRSEKGRLQAILDDPKHR